RHREFFSKEERILLCDSVLGLRWNRALALSNYPAEFLQRRGALRLGNQRKRADDVAKFVERQHVLFRRECLEPRHIDLRRCLAQRLRQCHDRSEGGRITWRLRYSEILNGRRPEVGG